MQVLEKMWIFGLIHELSWPVLSSNPMDGSQIVKWALGSQNIKVYTRVAFETVFVWKLGGYTQRYIKVSLIHYQNCTLSYNDFSSYWPPFFQLSIGSIREIQVEQL